MSLRKKKKDEMLKELRQKLSWKAESVHGKLAPISDVRDPHEQPYRVCPLFSEFSEETDSVKPSY